MGSFLSQTGSVILMNLKSLPGRIWMSMAMVLASTVVVSILLAFLAMNKGFETTIQGASSKNVAIFLREGSAAELNSVISRDKVSILETSPEIVSDDNGPVISAELYVIVDGVKKSSQTEANIPLRGLSPKGVNLRQNFELIEGRMFTPGTDEMIVGKGILNSFDGFDLGQDVRFGKNKWKIVGVFSTGGNVFESELWSDIKVLQSLYHRGSSVQIVRAKIKSEKSVELLKQFIKNDPRLNIDVLSEKDYFASQSQSLIYMAIFGKIISAVMALGALAGALNTMYTSVSDRSKEIATLRTIGFSNFSAFIGTLVEALILSSIGGILGVLFAYLLFDGMSTSTLGGSFTQVVFSFNLTPELMLEGVLLSLIIGFFSGVFPAWSAARMPILLAFRDEH